MFGVFFAGCSKVTEVAGLTGVCPKVISTSPADAAADVNLDKAVSATFNEPVNATSITSATFTLKQGTTPIAGVISYNDSTATFTPTNNLLPDTKYTGTITTGVKDKAGNSPVSDYVWTFTTGAGPDVIAPTVSSTDPANAATGVAFNKKISATFSELMDSLTINATTFALANTTAGGTKLTGTVTYTGTTAMFSPSVDLLPNTTYTATITTGAKDLAGNRLVSNYTWSFTTGAAPDIILPTVVSTDPLKDAVGVPFNKKITATFSKTMDASTISSTTFSLANTTLGGSSVQGTVTYSGTTAVFSPGVILLPNTTYTAVITTAAKDMAGNGLLNNYIWSFTTGAGPSIIPPVVISTDPANLAINVPLTKKIGATFSEAMDPMTISTATFSVVNTTLGGITVPGTVSYSGTTAVFSPASSLSSGITYTATISTGAKDLAGNAMVSSYNWSFTTGAALDVTPPTVVSTNPLNNAANVALNKTVTATFSEKMNPLTINNTTVVLKNGATIIAGTVTYNGTTATFSPSSNLAYNTTYTGTITTGAKDLAGNALVNDYVWSFTTLAAPVPPTVISTNPLNNAINVALNKKVTATFSKAMNQLTINNATFVLKNGAIAVAGTVTYSGTTATFAPLANLLSNTVYTATISTGAQDVAGNALVNDYVWSFTTAPPIIPPLLGSISIFGAFGGSAGITNQGLNTVINNGSIGTTGASTLVTGFHDETTGDIYTETPLNVGDVKGRIYTAPPAPGNATSFSIATQGLLDANQAYLAISPASKPGGSDPGAGELGGLTLQPGVYKSAGGAFKITNGDLTLDAKGDPNAVWIFQAPTSLTVGIAGPTGARNVMLINGATANNVFWYVGSAATINGAGGGIMTGNIIASAGVTFSTAGNAVQTVLNGRAISLNASVTMVNTTVNVPQ